MKSNRLLRIILTNTHLCFIELLSNKTRSIITSCGIFIGSLSLLANIAFIRGIDNDVKEKMEIIGGLNIVSIKTIPPVNKEQTRLFGHAPKLTIEDAQEIKNRFHYVTSLLPHIELPWGPAYASGKTTWASINAVNYDYFRAFNVEIQYGNNTTQYNAFLREPVCIAGPRVVSRLFGDNISPIGKTITLNKKAFRIIGIIKTDNTFSWRAWQIFIPYVYYNENFSSSNSIIDEISIELTNSSFEPSAQKDFTRTLLERHRGIKNFSVESNSGQIKEMKKASAGMKIILFIIAAISLFIGGISIMNIMFAAIGDRIREIGIRKSLGASKIDIILQFLVEAIFLCCVGGIPGIIAGGLVTLFPSGFFPFNPDLLISDYFISIFFILFTGIASGLAPAFKAAQMQPVDALKY